MPLPKRLRMQNLNIDEVLLAYKGLQSKRWGTSKSSSSERITKLLKLKSIIVSRRVEICEAIYADFKKPHAETELTEIHSVLDEINFAVKNVSKWMKDKSVLTPLTLFGAKSKIKYEAKGVCLIIAPWNYPFQLAMNPLVAAVAAGNVVMLKPSEKTPATSLIIQKIINEAFHQDEVYTSLGGVEVSSFLLDLPFDHIFFTGSTRVGKIVMEKAAKHLASVTLELGGKSPVIVDENVDLKNAARTIVWGKHVNAGQTCVAPDYLFVHKNVKDDFVKEYLLALRSFYGETESQVKNSHSYARLVDDQSVRRLHRLIDQSLQSGASCLTGGVANPEEKYLAPTLLDRVNTSMPIMQEELFGPVLPILEFVKIDEVISYIQKNDKPLALYVFSNSAEVREKIINETSSGGIVFNQVLIHLGNHHLPFGGVGGSGMGNYHGEFGFKAFSHERAVLIQSKFSLIPLYFPPYKTLLSDIAFKILRLFQ